MSARTHPQTSSLALLWYGLLAPPIAWATQLLAGYSLASQACQGKFGQIEAIEHTLTAGCIVVTLAAGACAIFEWRRTEGAGGLAHERAHFMARAGVVSCLLFLTLIVFSDAPTFFMRDFSCAPAR